MGGPIKMNQLPHLSMPRLHIPLDSRINCHYGNHSIHSIDNYARLNRLVDFNPPLDASKRLTRKSICNVSFFTVQSVQDALYLFYLLLY